VATAWAAAEFERHFFQTLDGTDTYTPSAYAGGFFYRKISFWYDVDRIFCKLNDYLAEMTVEFTYDKKQVIQGLRYHFLSRPEIKILLILVNVFAILSAILLYFKVIQPFSFLLFSILWFLLMLIFWRLLPQNIYRRSHTFQDRFTIDFADEMVTLRTENGEKSWPWKAFSKFVESPNFFHLYFDSRSFFLVPTDSFVDHDQMIAARNLIRSKVSV
jgi:hypothetical protein